tara:strand:- start:1493 stop:1771 length:279 start_codon:yes stop_codon:yes gene_type:complete
MPPEDDGNLVDKAISNPAFDQMFGYYIFFRRAAIPLFLFIIGLFTYTVLDSFDFSHDTSLILSFMVVGLSLGPVMNSERYFGSRLSRRKGSK